MKGLESRLGLFLTGLKGQYYNRTQGAHFTDLRPTYKTLFAHDSAR
jgi:hypothetical protein